MEKKHEKMIAFWILRVLVTCMLLEQNKYYSQIKEEIHLTHSFQCLVSSKTETAWQKGMTEDSSQPVAARKQKERREELETKSDCFGPRPQ